MSVLKTFFDSSEYHDFENRCRFNMYNFVVINFEKKPAVNAVWLLRNVDIQQLESKTRLCKFRILPPPQLIFRVLAEYGFRNCPKQIRIFENSSIVFPPFFRPGSLLRSSKIPYTREQLQIWGSANWYNSRNYGRLDLSSIEYKVKNLS